ETVALVRALGETQRLPQLHTRGLVRNVDVEDPRVLAVVRLGDGERPGHVGRDPTEKLCDEKEGGALCSVGQLALLATCRWPPVRGCGGRPSARRRWEPDRRDRGARAASARTS